MKLALVFLACIATSYTSIVWSSTALETIKVTGSRLNNINDGSYSAVNRAQIDLINPQSTLDLLRRIPHLMINENGPGGVSFVTLRGGESNFTLVLIDGIAVNDSTNTRGGGFDFNQLSPDAIEKIEVYRGGISAIYGSEAISGVIQIITRDTLQEKTQNTLSAELGSQNQINASATLTHNYQNGLTVLANLSSRKKKRSDNASTENKQALFNVSLNKSKYYHQLLLSLSDTQNTALAEDSGGELYAEPNIAEKRDSQQAIIGLSSKYDLAKKIGLNTKFSWLKRTEDSVHPGIADGVFSGIPASEIKSTFNRLEAEVFSEYAMSDTTNIVTGVNYRRIKGENDGALDFGFPLPVDYQLVQTNKSLFLEAQYQQQNYSLNIGWRFEDASGFDSETSLRIAGNYAVNRATSAFAVYSEGYKLPSFFALAHPLVGNANLQPERSKNLALGLVYANQRHSYKLSYFNNEFTDLVDFDAELFTNVNRNKVEASGIELSVVSTINNTYSVSSDVSYTDVSVDNGPSQLRRRPKWLGNVSLEAAFDNINVSIFTDITSDYLDSSIPTGLIKLGGYSTYGVAVNWQLNNKHQLTLNAQNVFAREIQESVGFISNNVNLRMGFTYTF